MPAAKEAVAPAAEPVKQGVHTSVVVHPIVLLSAVDHYNRVAKNTKRRVVGMLLGETYKGVTDVTNSYGVPFEEDERDPNIWCAEHAGAAVSSAVCRGGHAEAAAGMRLSSGGATARPGSGAREQRRGCAVLMPRPVMTPQYGQRRLTSARCLVSLQVLGP